MAIPDYYREGKKYSMSKRKQCVYENRPPIVPIKVRNRRLRINQRKTKAAQKRQAVAKQAHDQEVAKFVPTSWLINKAD